MNNIGALQETSLHAALKEWYAQPGDRLEAHVEDFIIDIYRDGLLIEIQSGNFTAIKQKLERLLPRYPIRLVHPIAQDKWIVRLAADGQTPAGRRKSPRRGAIYHLFRELVRLPTLLADPNFSIEVVLIQMEEVWRDDGRGSWRRKGWSIHDRRLLKVVDQIVVQSPGELAAWLPADLPDPFTTQELAGALKQPRSLAQKMAYCLRHLALIEVAGKKGNALLYRMAGDVL